MEEGEREFIARGERNPTQVAQRETKNLSPSFFLSSNTNLFKSFYRGNTFFLIARENKSLLQDAIKREESIQPSNTNKKKRYRIPTTTLHRPFFPISPPTCVLLRRYSHRRAVKTYETRGRSRVRKSSHNISSRRRNRRKENANKAHLSSFLMCGTRK